ncbi:MAG: hypothetical protein NUW37_04715 [Planctomycetes bacterium]|nr:hypothetical protein [Planctomycetota bacterium]
MKVSYGEGLANHASPESWRVVGNNGLQALTGESAGWATTPRNSVLSFGVPRLSKLLKTTSFLSFSQDRNGLREVEEPKHARKLLMRELGDPVIDPENGNRVRAGNLSGATQR